MTTSSTFLSRQSGVVLPVVLVVLVVVTTLVLTQVRRGTVDERLAGNWSRSISGETSAESTLRWCEMELQREPRLWDGVVLAANFAATPAWRTNTWNQAASILTIDAAARRHFRGLHHRRRDRGTRLQHHPDPGCHGRFGVSQPLFQEIPHHGSGDIP
jgi:Tfp pilus assembly protein PilX